MPRFSKIKPIVFCALMTLIGPHFAWAEDQAWDFKSFDQFVLKAKVSKAKDLKDEAVTKVVILIHGSGPSDMDGTFKVAAENKTGVFLYKKLAQALGKGRCAAIRYNKRSYEWRAKILKDRKVLETEEFKKAQKTPLSDLVKDTEAFAKYAQKRFPNAGIYLLGHSQGTFVGLQVAHKNKFIKGVGVIGMMASTLGTLSFEQYIYRPLIRLRSLDKNQDDALSMKELTGTDNLSVGLKMQFKVLDMNKDQLLSFDEVKAANFTSFMGMISSDVLRRLIAEEMQYPAIDKILAKCKFKVGFFQGEWDNQTPTYQVRAIELLNKFRWSNKQLKFWYFKKLGHDLGMKKDYSDVSYREIDKKALETVLEAFNNFFDSKAPVKTAPGDSKK
ncbi:MAG: hypothetical protein P1V97_08065 [Planctomycetota bacterium]|nr:hypothetical protein [Planctomycetota bacterium]